MSSTDTVVASMSQPLDCHQHRSHVNSSNPDGVEEVVVVLEDVGEDGGPQRKCGVHRLENHQQTASSSKVQAEDTNANHAISTAVVQVNITKKKRSVDTVVEAYLDEHPDFLNDYVRRKISRRQLEQWLFLPFIQTASTTAAAAEVLPTTSALLPSSNITQQPGGKPIHSSDSNLLLKTGALFSSSSSCVRGQQQQQHQGGQHERQRSRSFTPLRKLSATTFEAGGLATPILATTSDGQQSFLRTTTQTIHPIPAGGGVYSTATPPPSRLVASMPDSDNTKIHTSLESMTSTPSSSIILNGSSIKSRKDLLLNLLPSLLVQRSSDWSSFSKSLLTSANLLMGQAARVDLLILSHPQSQRSWHGTTYCLVDGAIHKIATEKSWFESNSLLTATLMTQTSRCINNANDGNGTTIFLPGLQQEDLFLVTNALMGPLKIKSGSGGTSTSGGRSQVTLGCLQLYNKSDGFTKEDEELFCQLTSIASLALASLQSHQEMRLELARSEVFLELARTLFKEFQGLESTMLTILTNFLSLIDCEKCQISLSDPERPSVFRRIFDLRRSEVGLDLEGPFENRLPINSEFTAKVATTGKKINLKLEDLLESGGGANQIRSFFCSPIHDSNGKVVGVISMANKEANPAAAAAVSNNLGLHEARANYFTNNDERFVEAFAIFCGMAIRNAADYEKAVVSEAKLQVAFEVMNYQATSSSTATSSLIDFSVPAASSINIDSFEFSYLNMDDNATLTATLRMFVDLGLVTSFNIDYSTLCRWLLTVKRNYRNETVQYHNWYHAFNVTQMMFCTITKTKWNQLFAKVEILGLIVACICHDLDHRGTNNPHQMKMNNPLARLYTTSTLERHHLNQCLLILTLRGNGILDNLTKDEYSETLAVIERSILATDLALHFRDAPFLHALSEQVLQSPENLAQLMKDPNHRQLLQAGMMTSSDLGNAAKPWKVHRYVSQLIAEEFWTQGDIERQELNVEPQPMFDRSVALSTVQIDFLDLCIPLYKDMANFSSELMPLLKGCQENRQVWAKMDQECANNTAGDLTVERARNL